MSFKIPIESSFSLPDFCTAILKLLIILFNKLLIPLFDPDNHQDYSYCFFLKALKIKNLFDLLKQVYKYLDFIQYIFKSLDGNCKNDDDDFE